MGPAWPTDFVYLGAKFKMPIQVRVIVGVSGEGDGCDSLVPKTSLHKKHGQ